MLSSSSGVLHRELMANPTRPIHIFNVQPNSMRILIRYLYSQDIDDAIENRNSINVWNCRTGHGINHISKLSLYKDLLKLAERF
ncbi:7429_t:CDS:1, partial [Funneliformis geosporum]